MALQAACAPAARSLPTRPPSAGLPFLAKRQCRGRVLAEFVASPEVSAWKGLSRVSPPAAACRHLPLRLSFPATCPAAVSSDTLRNPVLNRWTSSVACLPPSGPPLRRVACASQPVGPLVAGRVAAHRASTQVKWAAWLALLAVLNSWPECVRVSTPFARPRLRRTAPCNTICNQHPRPPLPLPTGSWRWRCARRTTPWRPRPRRKSSC